MTSPNPLPPSIAGYRTKLLNFSDLPALQDLMEKSADYIELVYGSPPSSNEAEMLVAGLPPHKTLDDKYLIGIFDSAGELAGIVDAIKDYPGENEWWVGLQLLAPGARGRGTGRELYHAFESWAAGQGAQQIYLGVVEANSRAYAFWERLGFKLVERRPPRDLAIQHDVLVMHRQIDPERQE